MSRILALMRVLATVRSDLEASLICGRLQEAGIPSMQRSEQLPEYSIGGCSVLVEDHDLARAREILAEETGGFDEQQLAQLSQQAAQRAHAHDRGRQQPAQTRQPRHWLRRFLGRRRTPESPFGR